MARTKQTKRDQKKWQSAVQEAIESLEEEKRQRARASKSNKVAHGNKKRAKQKRNRHDNVKVVPKKEKKLCETAEKPD